MKEKILEYLKKSNVPRSIAELKDALQISEKDLRSTLDAMTAEGAVAETKKGKYAPPEKLGLTLARVGFTRNGSPIAKSVDEGTTQPLHILGGLRVMPGDLVLVHADAMRCELERIVTRGKDTIAAFIRVETRKPKGTKRWQSEEKTVITGVPCDLRIPYDIVLHGDTSFVRNNQIALLKIDVWPEQNRPIYATPLRVLGNSDSMPALMRSVAEAHGFETEPNEAVEAEAAAFGGEVSAEGREDLRGKTIFTIDGATAKDFDDAVSLEQTEEGWLLGVHIADVSHYVRRGSAIDADALARGTSLYLPGLTVPMLPERLCNDLCSLRPDEDRYALSLFMTVKNGSVTDHRLCRSVIRSCARLTYASVNRLFDGEATDVPEAIRPILFDMRALSLSIRAARTKNGCIDLDLAETEFVLDENGEPADILPVVRGDAEKLIEDFMLTANATVAALAKHLELPLIYRIHEAPDPERLRTLEQFLSTVDLPTHLGNDPHPGQIAKVLERAKDTPAEDVIRRYVLRAMSKARYSENPLGHYALAMPDYCHFTSPIRRYPDLTVHRVLHAMLDGNLKSKEDVPAVANACSVRENAAVTAERLADDMLKAAYMSKQIGRKFNGMVTGITRWGLYVTLANGVEGLVPVSTLDDYYEYDRDRNQLVGTATGIVFRLGSKVRIRVDSADTLRGEIGFLLVPPLRRERAVSTREEQ